MIRSLAILFLACAFPHVLLAQVSWRQNGTKPFDDSTKFYIELNGYRSDYSNSLNRGFVQTAVFGGYIDNELKYDVFGNLENQNDYAGLNNLSASVTFFPDSSRLGYTLGFEQNNLASLSFSKDFYELAFYGNVGFGSDPADLSNTREDYFSYQRLGFGIVDKKTGAFASLGVYNAHSTIRYSADDFFFQTEFDNINGFEYASAIHVDVENFQSQETKREDGLFKSGIGFGISGGYTFQISKGNLNIGVNDLGAMNWKNLSSRDTTGSFSFEGVSWDIGSDNSLRDLLEALEDSLVPNATIKDEWRILPGIVRATYFTDSEKKWMASLGVSYQWAMELVPEFQAGVYYQYGKDNIVWATGNFGGYYGATLGLGTELTVLENSRITLGSLYFPGLVSENALATNLFLKYSLRI